MTGPRAYHQVPVAGVVEEAGDACSLVLAVPPDLAGAFAYQPGQFLTVRVPDGAGGSVARCYSLSSSPHAGDAPAITVKRMAGGYASNWIADNVRPGAVLDLLPPAGTFTPRSLDGDFLMFAGGSGITPVISIVKSVLAAGRGRIALIYANRDEASVIFGPELRGLAAAAPDRLVAVHWLDSVQGAPTAAAMAALARPWARAEPFLCGPDPFLALARQALGSLGVPPQRVRVERFLSLAENPFEARPQTGGIAATLEVSLDGLAARDPDARRAHRPGPGPAVLLPPGRLRRVRLPAHRRAGGDGAQRGAGSRRRRRRLHPGLPGRGAQPRGRHHLLVPWPVCHGWRSHHILL
jgi:3-ketosteroid 9alpha-monooxygenase subunit B